MNNAFTLKKKEDGFVQLDIDIVLKPCRVGTRIDEQTNGTEQRPGQKEGV